MLSRFQCPADTTLERSSPFLNGTPPDSSFGANGGLFPRVNVDPAPYNNSAAYLRVMNRHNGVFHDLVRQPSARTTIDTLYDGASNTVMYSENLQAGWWVHTGDVDEIGQTAAHRNRLSTMLYYLYVQAPQQTLGQTAPATMLTPEMKINGRRRSVNLRPETARPSSEHPGGVNMAFCDGRVAFVSQKMDYHVYVSLMAPRDRRADIPWRDYVLQSGHYLPR